EGTPARVVTVQMRQQHGINTVVGNALLREGNERRRTKIDGKSRTRRIDQYTGLKTPPTPECISGADESHADCHVSRLLVSAHGRHSALHRAPSIPTPCLC